MRRLRIVNRDGVRCSATRSAWGIQPIELGAVQHRTVDQHRIGRELPVARTGIRRRGREVRGERVRDEAGVEDRRDDTRNASCRRTGRSRRARRTVRPRRPCRRARPAAECCRVDGIVVLARELRVVALRNRQDLQVVAHANRRRQPVASSSTCPGRRTTRSAPSGPRTPGRALESTGDPDRSADRPD